MLGYLASYLNRVTKQGGKGMAEYLITFTVGEECEITITADSEEEAVELFYEDTNEHWQNSRSIETRTDITDIKEEVRA